MGRLRELRLRKNLTQRDLAYKIGVTPRYIAFLETGSRKPSIEVAGKIANLLEASIEEIFMPFRCTISTSKGVVINYPISCNNVILKKDNPEVNQNAKGSPTSPAAYE